MNKNMQKIENYNLNGYNSKRVYNWYENNIHEVITMIFCKGNKYIFSKDVYLASDERVEKLNDNQIDQYDGLEVQVAHSYLGYINNSRISSSWCKEVK